MWGQADLKKTRAYQEAEQAGEEKVLKVTVPLLLEKGMTIEEIAQHFKLSIETLQRFAFQK